MGILMTIEKISLAKFFLRENIKRIQSWIIGRSGRNGLIYWV